MDQRDWELLDKQLRGAAFGFLEARIVAQRLQWISPATR